MAEVVYNVLGLYEDADDDLGILCLGAYTDVERAEDVRTEAVAQLAAEDPDLSEEDFEDLVFILAAVVDPDPTETDDEPLEVGEESDG